MTSKDNILLVANWESGVGYAWWLMDNFWVTISDHFESAGKVSYLIYPKITQVPATVAASGINVMECDFSDHSIKNLIKLHSLIKNKAITNIYLSDSPSHSLFYLLLRLWGIKKIVVHDHTPGERSIPAVWLKAMKTIIQKIPLFTADHFIAVTDYVNQRLIEVSCIPENKCSVAPNGIRPYDLNNIDDKYAHHCFDIPEYRHIVVTTGRASYYKGIDFFITSANELINIQGLDNLHFLFCGDGPDMSDFRSLAKSLKIEEHFTFAGKRQDIEKILPSCYIGFHSATGEVGYSLSILEYMSAGLVTIVPDGPSTSLSIEDLKDGILYKYRDLKSASDAIRSALEDDNREKIISNAIPAVQNKFNIENTNKKLIEILNLIYIT